MKKKTKMRNTTFRRNGAASETIATPQELRVLIRKLSPASPITNRFTAAWERLEPLDGQQEQKDPGYKTQHEHWLGWLKGWDGPGGYGRSNWNRSAAFVYNHIVNPKMLVYLAEAVRLPKAQVDRAVDAALARPTMMAMSGAIRRLIPWETIEEALLRGSTTR